MLGPRYLEAENKLRWTCGRCGFVRVMAPLDQLRGIDTLDDLRGALHPAKPKS